MPLYASVRTLKGVGEKRAALYEKMGIRTVMDLLEHYPRAYEDWSRPALISEAQPGSPAASAAGWPTPPPSTGYAGE